MLRRLLVILLVLWVRPGTAQTPGDSSQPPPAGLNWYLNPYVKWHFGFTRTIFDGDAGGPRRAENVLPGRAQLPF